jgi:hypothetical protein
VTSKCHWPRQAGFFGACPFLKSFKPSLNKFWGLFPKDNCCPLVL